MDGFALRMPCKHCENSFGKIETRNGQDCVFCGGCGKYQYNAPKTETGRKVRSVSTTHAAITPKQRSRIIDRANGRCERCGADKAAAVTGLHIGHVVSVKLGHELGLSDDVINSDENLITECDQCNAGRGSHPMPLRVFVAILTLRLRKTAEGIVA